MSRVAIYPGSFDPVTNGHLDIIDRALAMFEHVIVGIAHNPNKAGLFTPDERAALLASVLGDDERLEIEVFSGLLVDYVRNPRGEYPGERSARRG